MEKINLNIVGVHCKSCKALIEEELEDAGATNINVTVDAEAQTGTVECETDKSVEEITELIETLGEYKVSQ